MTKKSCFMIVAVSLFVSEIAWQIWKYIRNNDDFGNNENAARNKKLVATDGNEVLMFTEDGKQCRDHANTPTLCKKKGCPVDNVRRIHWYLSNALNTLDVCMYIMTCDYLTKGVIRSKKQGARVRVIIDSGMSEHPACNGQILLLRRAGIEVRTNQLQPMSLMHHKFAVIDGQFVIFGSTNWTMQAFYGNNDSILVTNNKECLNAYSTEFDKMWQNFEP